MDTLYETFDLIRSAGKFLTRKRQGKGAFAQDIAKA